jgi:hypothetical protein
MNFLSLPPGSRASKTDDQYNVSQFIKSNESKYIIHLGMAPMKYKRVSWNKNSGMREYQNHGSNGLK